MNSYLSQAQQQFKFCRCDSSISQWDKLRNDQWKDLVEFVKKSSVAVDFLNQMELKNLTSVIPGNFLLMLEGSKWAAEESQNRFFSEINKVSEILSAAGVEFILLKGAAMIASGYLDCSGQRAINDIDIVVSPDKLEIAYTALTKAGFYSPVKIQLPLHGYWFSKHLPPMYHDCHTYAIELHQFPFEDELTQRAPISVRDMFNDSRIIDNGGIEYRIPSAEHVFISAFFHSQIEDGHELSGRINYRAMLDCLLVVNARDSSLDWDSIESIVSKAGLAPSLNLFLHQVAEALDPSARHWPICRAIPRIKYIKYLLAKRFPITFQFLNTVRLHTREIIRVIRPCGAIQRKALANVNPSNYKFQPIWRQLLSLRMLRDRISYFIKMLRM